MKNNNKIKIDDKIRAQVEADTWLDLVNGKFKNNIDRLGIGFVLAIFTSFTGVDYKISVTWFCLCLVTHFFDLFFSKKLLKSPKNLVLRKYICLSTLISSIVFSTIIPISWFLGNESAKAVTLAVIASALLVVSARSQKLPKIHLAMALPYLLWVPIVQIFYLLKTNGIHKTEIFLVLLTSIIGVIYVLRSFLFSFANAEILSEAIVNSEQRRVDAYNANNSKSRFLANMSHELRTPMNGVLGSASLLANSAKSPKDKELVKTLIHSSQSIITLLNDMLDHSKIETGTVELEEFAFSPIEILNNCQTLWQKIIEEKQINFSQSIQGIFPSALKGDATRIEQILNIFMSNSTKYTKEGSISLFAKYLDGHLIIAVSDTSAGLNDAQLEGLFNPFGKYDDNINRNFGGTGLGLANAKKLAQLMGGELRVESAIGLGTTFTLELPLAITDASKIQQVFDDEAMHFKHPAPFLRILVADDNASSRYILGRYLEMIGASVDMINDGNDAVEAARSRRYDIILLDVRMPIMDGLSACKEIRKSCQNNAQTPIIIVSADASPNQIKHGLNAGADGYITKPIDSNKLYAILEKSLEGRAAFNCNP